uniref:Uncharacterized protein n=1 Tax=Lepeophtheirus salmonis TaxID=72036 RepID=A0A0K2TLZ9_LEPSM
MGCRAREKQRNCNIIKSIKAFNNVMSLCTKCKELVKQHGPLKSLFQYSHTYKIKKQK